MTFNVPGKTPKPSHRLNTASTHQKIDPTGIAPGAQAAQNQSSMAQFTPNNDPRLNKVCPICKAAPGGKCLEKTLWGSRYIETPHKERYE